MIVFRRIPILPGVGVRGFSVAHIVYAMMGFRVSSGSIAVAIVGMLALAGCGDSPPGGGGGDTGGSGRDTGTTGQPDTGFDDAGRPIDSGTTGQPDTGFDDAGRPIDSGT